jgi:hypothetical protein
VSEQKVEQRFARVLTKSHKLVIIWLLLAFQVRTLRGWLLISRLCPIFWIVTSTISLAGCGGGASGGGEAGVGPAAASIYVTQDVGILDPPLPSKILRFSTTADGVADPASTITGPNDVVFNGLAVDGTGSLYVGGAIFNGGGEVLVYAPGTSGTPTPTRTITIPVLSVGVNTPPAISALAVDSSGNIYVSSTVVVNGLEYLGISIFPPTASGDVAPTKVIAGNATDIFPVGFGAGQFAVDSADNIYIAGGSLQDPDAILIFDSSSTGNVPPTNTLSGSNTMIDDVTGVALDDAGNIYVANGNVMGSTPSILEFSAGSTGNVAPIRILSGSATTMVSPGNLSLDSAGNIYVLNNLNILKFSPSATGNVAPAATISSVGFVEVNSIAIR